MKPAPSNSARWFSQLGSLIQTCALGQKSAQEVGADLQAAGAAQRLHGDDAAFLHDAAVGAEYQLLHRLVVGRDAVDRQVGAAARLSAQQSLGASRTHSSSGTLPSSS